VTIQPRRTVLLPKAILPGNALANQIVQTSQPVVTPETRLITGNKQFLQKRLIAASKSPADPARGQQGRKPCGLSQYNPVQDTERRSIKCQKFPGVSEQVNAKRNPGTPACYRFPQTRLSVRSGRFSGQTLSHMNACRESVGYQGNRKHWASNPC